MKKILTIAISMMIAFTTINAAQEAVESLKFKTITGKEIEIIGTEKGFNIPQYKDKVVFVEFWGTHCPPCLRSIPHYIDLQKKYKDNLAILAVEVQNKPLEGLKEFAKVKGMNYDVVSYKDGLTFVEYISQRAGWSGSIPFLVILDTKGQVQIVQPGLIPEEQLENVIKEMSGISKVADNNTSTKSTTTEQNSTKK